MPSDIPIALEMKQTEAVSQAPARADVRAESQTSETVEAETNLDMDAIARDVYNILKRRLYRERERAFGLS